VFMIVLLCDVKSMQFEVSLFLRNTVAYNDLFIRDILVKEQWQSVLICEVRKENN